jgi:hypothetical protein
MRQLYVLFICVSVVILSSLISGCNSQQPEGDIWPLAVGNQWIYKTSEKINDKPVIDTVTVTRDTLINGEKWFYTKHTAHPISWILKNKPDGLYIIDREKNSPFIFLKYKAIQGDTYFNMIDTILVKQMDKVIKTEAGTFTCFQYNSLKADRDQFLTDDGIYASPGVGVVQFQTSGMWSIKYELIKFNLKNK